MLVLNGYTVIFNPVRENRQFEILVKKSVLKQIHEVAVLMSVLDPKEQLNALFEKNIMPNQYSLNLNLMSMLKTIYQILIRNCYRQKIDPNS